MQNRIREFSQAMKRRLVRTCRKNLTDAIDSLGQIIAFSIIVVAQHCLHNGAHERQCGEGYAENECVVRLLQALVD